MNGLGGGFFSKFSKFEDEQVIWTTEGNQSLLNKEASTALFEGSSSSVRPVRIMIDAKQPNATAIPNLLTR